MLPSAVLTNMTTPTKPRVLLVDDDDDVREAVARLLRRRFDAVSVNSAEAALAYLTHETVDAIVSDLEMGPGKNGIELFLAIERDFPALADRFILHTGTPERAQGRVPRVLSKGEGSVMLPRTLEALLLV